MKYLENYYGFVYEWIDLSNNKTYIGSHYGSVDDGYIGSGKKFLNAYKKRPCFFQRKILSYLKKDNRNELLLIEQVHLNQIDWLMTYNISPTASGGDTISKLNKNELKIYKDKLKSRNPSRKGAINSDAHNQKIREYHLNKVVSAETRLKISESKKGKSRTVFSKETKQKMSESAKNRKGRNKKSITKQKPLRNKCISESTKKKISESLKGIIRSDETKKKISKANKGKKRTPEQINNIKKSWNKSGNRIPWNKGILTL